jgi:hypothetical protein
MLPRTVVATIKAPILGQKSRWQCPHDPSSVGLGSLLWRMPSLAPEELPLISEHRSLADQKSSA